MHGHAMRLLAEQEHIDEWADVTVGAIYGAIKRLAAEGLIDAVRLEREGNYPERQVFDITASGRESLRSIRRQALETIVYRPDPVDLAIARLGADDIDDLEGILEARVAELHVRIAEEETKPDRIGHHLTVTELYVTRHDLHRLRGELAWHQELLGALPGIIADETSRKKNPA